MDEAKITIQAEDTDNARAVLAEVRKVLLGKVTFPGSENIEAGGTIMRDGGIAIYFHGPQAALDEMNQLWKGT